MKVLNLLHTDSLISGQWREKKKFLICNKGSHSEAFITGLLDQEVDKDNS